MTDTPHIPSRGVKNVIDLLISREAAGLKKYGTDIDRTDLSHEQWMQHLLEELLDGANYIMAARNQVQRQNQEYALLRKDIENLIREHGGVFDKADFADMLKKVLFNHDSGAVLRNIARK